MIEQHSKTFVYRSFGECTSWANTLPTFIERALLNSTIPFGIARLKAEVDELLFEKRELKWRLTGFGFETYNAAEGESRSDAHD